MVHQVGGLGGGDSDSDSSKAYLQSTSTRAGNHPTCAGYGVGIANNPPLSSSLKTNGDAIEWPASYAVFNRVVVHCVPLVLVVGLDWKGDGLRGDRCQPRKRTLVRDSRDQAKLTFRKSFRKREGCVSL